LAEITTINVDYFVEVRTKTFTTEVTLQLDDLPPTNNVMVVTHFMSIEA
jgi:hypothetical protein